MPYLPPPDPSLNIANILQATHHIPLWGSRDSYSYLDMPESQHDEIASKCDGEQAKLELFTAWLASHPCPTWEHVRHLLRWLEGQGKGRAGAVKEVDDTYLKSEFYCIPLIIRARRNVPCSSRSSLSTVHFSVQGGGRQFPTYP